MLYKSKRGGGRPKTQARAEIQAALVRGEETKKAIAARVGVNACTVSAVAREIGPALEAVEELRKQYLERLIKTFPVDSAVARQKELITQDVHLPTAFNALKLWQQNTGILTKDEVDKPYQPLFVLNNVRVDVNNEDE